MASGFDDDAWSVKPSSRQSTPAPTPAKTPPLEPAPLQSRPSLQASADVPARTNSAAAGSTLSDNILASMGIGNRPPSAPLHRQQPPASTGMSPQGSQQAYNPNAPRGPIAPIAANAPLLNPLIPTQTGFNQFIPTRSATGFGGNSPMLPQATGFVGNNSMMMPQQTGYNQSPMMPQQTSFNNSPMMPQMTGFVQPQQQMQPNPMQMQPLQAQPTGFAATSYLSQPQPMMHTSSMPPMPSIPSALSARTASTPATKYEPGNIFASMKQGTFTKDPNALPQAEQKYDALRPQPTGMPMGSLSFAQPW